MSGSTVKASVITATIDPTRKPPISAQPSRTSNSYSLLRLLIPAVPNLLFHTGAHILSLSQTTSYWDLKTTLTITFLRKFMSRPKSNVTVEQAQRRMNFPVPVALDTHRVNVAFATSKDVAQFKSIETAVRDTIVSFGEGKIVDSQIPHTTVERLTAEWIGYRKEFRADSIEAPDGAEAYASLIDDLGNDGQPSTTVLYFHGGGYSMCDPHTHRKSITKLACAANAQVFVCRYRLAPQSPFPAALIDALVSYLYLLQPPEGAFHDPIPSPKIVFAGDSAGGGLSLALLQLLFHLNRNKITLRWYGKDMCPPLPAGIGLISAWCDVSRAFSSLSGMANGSEDSCQPFDYLPAPAAVARFTYCDSSAWNRALRRERQQHQLYAADVLVDNPLVSPMLAKSWTNMGSTVPVWMSIGDECLRDSNIFLASG
jgi:acetyl esterase/lipase